MAYFPGHNVGLTIPGRPSTPCNGRAQYFRRPGDPMKQVTRTFDNGTTLTFGPEDIVSKFKAGDAFYEQFLTVQAAGTDIMAIRQQYREGGFAAISENGKTVGQRELGNVDNSSLRDSFAALSITPELPQIGGREKATKFGNTFLGGTKPRNFTKGSRKDRRRQRSIQASEVSNSDNRKDSKKFGHSGPTHPVSHNSYGIGGPTFAVQQASTMVAQGRTLPAIPAHQPGNPHETYGVDVPPLITQQASAMATHGSILPVFPMPQPGFPVNAHGVGWNVSAAQPTSYVTAQGHTLPGFYFPDPNYYGPSFRMCAAQQNMIMAANGIKLPATYIPDPRYYSGPLYWLAPHVAQAIMMAADSSQHPAFPRHRSRSQLMHATMLQPYALPPHCYPPGTTQMEIHIAECNRHTQLMQEVLAIPGDSNNNEEPMMWYRVLGTPRLRREPPVWHPSVIDLYGNESQYEQLFVRDVNHRNSNERGVGRKNAPVNRQTRMGATMRLGTFSQEAPQKSTGVGVDQGFQKNPAMMHARQESEETSIFYRDNRTASQPPTDIQYIGYSLRVKKHREQSLELSPTPPSRGRSVRSLPSKTPLHFNRSYSATHGEKREFSTKTPLNFKRRCSSTHEREQESSTSKTPLLDFDSRYSAIHGEGDDVDFALRDLGPPRIDGKTFNEAIGYTPSPERRSGSSAHLFYPIVERRGPRD